MNTFHRLTVSSVLRGASAASAWSQTVLAPTPPMGWNSWDSFGTGVTEAEVKANADYMARYMAKSGAPRHRFLQTHAWQVRGLLLDEPSFNCRQPGPAPDWAPPVRKPPPIRKPPTSGMNVPPPNGKKSSPSAMAVWGGGSSAAGERRGWRAPQH